MDPLQPGLFPTEDCLFSRGSVAVVSESTGTADDPVARNEVGNRISPDGTSHGPAGCGFPDYPGQILVAGQTPRRDAQQSLPDLDLEIGALEQQGYGGALILMQRIKYTSGYPLGSLEALLKHRLWPLSV